MRVTVFTSNQPRHIALLEKLSQICEAVYGVIETTTVFPGQVEDFYKKTVVMQDYFSRVLKAEREVFGQPRFLPPNVHSLNIKMGDLRMLDIKDLNECLNSDIYLVFGSSLIKESLLAFLIEKKAVNIHMGTSPYYRGNSCNFWAGYDGNFDYVGATIHLLSKEVDGGDILFHAFPKAAGDAFELGMKAVESAQNELVKRIKNGTLLKQKAVVQNKRLEIRCTRNQDFTDKVAQEYLDRLPKKNEILEKLKSRNMSQFIV